MKNLKYILPILVMTFSLQATAQICADVLRTENFVEIKKSQLVINGEPQPNLYGAEFQYFRLRGGYEKNVPREKVIELWARGLDQMVKAGMNTISFYIPWDFHEYAPGKFDFKGTVDTDGNGKADYPSRDIVTFLRMIEERGIKRIMLRPGPYVNAEWGFLGFGAVPEWFHDQYPDSHMRNPRGLKTKLYSYHDENFLRHTKLWFEELHKQVLVNVIGRNKPGIFLQLDNETNYQWQPLQSHDYGPAAVARYQSFLKNHYRTLAALNTAQGTNLKSWKDVVAPGVAGKNIAQDQDWYRFQDRSIFDYLKKIKNIWEDIGVREPNVIFTLAESFNAAKNGLLPNYRYRNSKKTGLMAINVYPKTDPAPDNILMHMPHKADYDVVAAAAANQYRSGKKQELVIGPEIGTGWFAPTVLTTEARQQTYLTLLGRGMKALYFYYFNEGNNWQVEWGRKKIQPYFEDLYRDERYSKFPKDQLPGAFWNELQDQVDRELMVGWNVRDVLEADPVAAQHLGFGAPLNGEARPTKHFKLIKEIGQKIIRPYGEFLSRTVSLHDSVALVVDSSAFTPSSIPGVDSLELHSNFAGGLFGYMQQAGINPSVHHWKINSNASLKAKKIIFVQDSGNLDPALSRWLSQYVVEGGTVVSFLGDSVAREIGAPLASKVSSNAGAVQVSYKNQTFDALARSVSEYNISANSAAQSVLVSAGKTVGYRIPHGKGTLIQLGAILHDAFNADAYAFLTDVPQRRAFLDDLVVEKQIERNFKIAEGGDRIDVFGKKAPNQESLWITVKSGQLEKTKFHVQISENLLKQKSSSYAIKNVLTGKVQKVLGSTLVAQGFPVTLEANGSAAYFVEPLP